MRKRIFIFQEFFIFHINWVILLYFWGVHHLVGMDTGLFKRIVGSKKFGFFTTALLLVLSFVSERHIGNKFNLINDVFGLLLFLFVILKVEGSMIKTLKETLFQCVSPGFLLFILLILLPIIVVEQSVIDDRNSFIWPFD